MLEIRDLAVTFATETGPLEAVSGVDFALAPGRALALIGESGCGKSTIALSILQLHGGNAMCRTRGQVLFAGQDLVRLSRARLDAIRGNRIGIIFQEPMTSLNPSMTVGAQIGEVLRRHRGLGAATARSSAIELLAQVRLPEPSRRVDDYPHQLSGGMRQRAMIAMAIACKPDLLIADEPTTALDVTVQAEILSLLHELRQELGMAILLITHDLATIADIVDDIAVMYAGRIVEQGPVRKVLEAPEHPYTVGLLGAMPSLHAPGEPLATIPGQVPSGTNKPAGCHFHPRCPFSTDQCVRERPRLQEVMDSHVSACWRTPLETHVA